MILWKTVDIGDTQRALLFRRNRFEKILMPGRHKITGFGGDATLEYFDVTSLYFGHPNAKFMIAGNQAYWAQFVDAHDMSDKELGLVFRDDHIIDVISPGSFVAIWKTVANIRIERISIAETYEIPESLLDVLGRGSLSRRKTLLTDAVFYVEVPDEHVGLLTVNRRLQKILPPGSYGYWKFNRLINVNLMDLRMQSIDVNGQEILTKDRVSLRINLSGSYRTTDPQKVAAKLSDYAGFVYRELQLRLRQIVGTRTLDNLLEDKECLNKMIVDAARSNLQDYGLEVVTLGVKDIILPGEMKAILNRVVEAQKESEANLIKRREETQAMRSLHNTAKMMENNPILLRLKELESLERVTTRIDRISVYGGLDGVLKDLVTLSPKS